MLNDRISFTSGLGNLSRYISGIAFNKKKSDNTTVATRFPSNCWRFSLNASTRTPIKSFISGVIKPKVDQPLVCLVPYLEEHLKPVAKKSITNHLFIFESARTVV